MAATSTLLEASASDAVVGGAIELKVNLTGGLELLCDGRKNHVVSLPKKDGDGRHANMAFLIRHIGDRLIDSKRRDMFIQEDTVRPGILVLINDADWEIDGGEAYELKTGDEVLFVSTLHGG